MSNKAAKPAQKPTLISLLRLRIRPSSKMAVVTAPDHEQLSEPQTDRLTAISRPVETSTANSGGRQWPLSCRTTAAG